MDQRMNVTQGQPTTSCWPNVAST